MESSYKSKQSETFTSEQFCNSAEDFQRHLNTTGEIRKMSNVFCLTKCPIYSDSCQLIAAYDSISILIYVQLHLNITQITAKQANTANLTSRVLKRT